MIRWITGWSIGLRYLILVIAGALMVFGVVQIRQMPVDVYPEFDPPLVEIQTEALGLSAAEMEALLTVPMEADLLNGVAWLDQIYSESVLGLSRILLVFEPGTDPIRARQMVQERLTQTFALPNVSKPPTMLQPLSTTNRVMMIGLSSDDLSLTDVGVLARWNIRPRLMGVPGVANVAIWGQRERQLQVQVDPAVLRDNGVTLEQVIATTGEALWVSPLSYLESSTPGTAGWIDTPNQRLSLRHELPISSAEDLARVPVKGTAWRLGDVATVVEDHQPLIGDSILENGPGLLLVVEKFPGANTLEVTQGVEAAIDAMRPGLSGVEIDPTVFRPASYIELAASNLATALAIGAAIGVVILALFYFEWRGVVISVTVILASLVTALFILYLRGSTFNLMILAGLTVALGVIVDDAVVAVENVLRRLRARTGDEATLDVIAEALIEMRGPLGFATLIIIMSVLPALVLEGLTADFFRPLTTTYLLAVLASFAVALILAPALTAVLYSGGSFRRDLSPVVRFIQSVYERILTRTVAAAGAALAVAVATIAVGLLMVPFLETSVLPQLRQTELRIEWDAAPGTSLGAMSRTMTQVSEELRGISGVRSVGSHLGRAITGDKVVGVNSGEIWVGLNPDADYESTVAEVRAVVSSYPGAFRAIEPYQPQRLSDVLTGSNQDLSVRIYGHEFDVLRTKAGEVGAMLGTIDGVSEVQIEPIPEEPQVEIEVDLAKSERLQVKPGDIRRSAATLLSGLQVGNLYEEQKVFDVVVWGTPEIRRNLTDIRQLLIDTPRGGHVRLEEVADVRIAPAATIIRRDAVSRYIDVNAAVSGRDLDSVLADVDRGLDGISFPLEYHAELVGQSVDRQAAQQRILLVLAIAAIGIFLLFQAAFGSWPLAAVATGTLPVALVGGILATVLAGGVVSSGTIYGALAILAIAVRSAVLMVRHLQNLEQEEDEVFGPELVVRGARERIAPILTTSLVLAALLLPPVLMGGVAGTEALRPMAVAILGGLVTATLLSLLILPPLYLRYGRIRAPQWSDHIAGVQPELTPSSD